MERIYEGFGMFMDKLIDTYDKVENAISKKFNKEKPSNNDNYVISIYQNPVMNNSYCLTQELYWSSNLEISNNRINDEMGNVIWNKTHFIIAIETTSDLCFKM